MKRSLVFVFLAVSLFVGSFLRPADSVLAQDSTVSATPIVIQSPELTNLAVFLQQFGYALVGNPNNNTGAKKDLGVVGFLASTMDLMISRPPASSIDYIAYMGNKLHFPGAPTVAYAAPSENPGGYGFKALQPILPIWTVMRNLAYVIFALVFVVVGFMIMLRVKIDPKTVTTIQNALPKMIFALLLVTFSYAIAGFLVDLMYLLIHIILAVAISAGMNQDILKAYQDYLLGTNSWILGIPNQLIGLMTGFWATVGLTTMIFDFLASPDALVLTTIVGTIAGIIFSPFTGGTSLILGGIIGFFGGATVALTGAILGAIIGFIVISIMVLWALFKTWLMLLNAYANIILGIIFAPVYLMLEAVPGQSQFWNWLRGMLANLVAFPAVVGILLITLVVTSQGALYGAVGSLNDLANLIFCQSQTGQRILAQIPGVSNICVAIANRPDRGFIPPLVGGNALGSMQALVGLAILLTMPKTVEIIQEWFKVPPFKYGGAWMEGLSTGPVGWTRTIGGNALIQQGKDTGGLIGGAMTGVGQMVMPGRK